MERIRQSFRRKKNKHSQQTDNNFEVETVFETVDDEDPKPLSRLQKIRHSLRTLKKKNKKLKKDEQFPSTDGVEDKFTDDLNDEEEDDKDEVFSVKDEIEDEPLDKKSKFRFSFRKKKKSSEGKADPLQSVEENLRQLRRNAFLVVSEKAEHKFSNNRAHPQS